MTDHGPIELRSAAITAVDYPARTLSLVVAPYDEWAEVEHRGKIIEESIDRGAFGAIRNRARKFLVNMEHDPTRWIGTVLDLDPDHTAGFVASVKIRRSAEGDQALNDAADELLGGSIGMAVSANGQTMTGGRRRIHKAFLDHIALTATPAYLGARVLEVRASAQLSSTAPKVTVETSSTPNLDRILAERRAHDYGSRLM